GVATELGRDDRPHRRGCSWATMGSDVGLGTFAAILLPLGYGGRFIILRKSKRVSRDRWQGPVLVDRFGRHSRGYYGVMATLALLADAVFIQLAWWSFARAHDTRSFWTCMVLILMTSAGVVISIVGYRRSTP